MRVAILSLGTRGDLELFLGLAQALRARGIEVVFGTSAFFAEAVRAADVEWTPIGHGRFEELQACLRDMGRTDDLVARTRHFHARWTKRELDAAGDQLQALAGRASFFVSNLKLVLQRDGRRVPSAFVDYDPPLDLAGLARFGTQNPEHRRTTLDLVAMNRALVDPDGEWPEQFRFTGFWRGPTTQVDRAPDPELARFVSAGPPPVAVTLGSMASFDAPGFLDALRSALRHIGQRAIVVQGWSALAPSRQSQGDDVHCVAGAPYDWLFPRSVCVVHHGGTGTVTSVLRAGRTSVLVPQIACQAAFGRILERHGLAAASLRPSQLTADAIARALERAIDDRDLKRAASRWQAIVSEEDGVARAAAAIEQRLRGLERGQTT